MTLFSTTPRRRAAKKGVSTRASAPVVATLTVAALALGALACGKAVNDPGGLVCTTEARAAISVTMVDSLTGSAAGMTGTWARAVDGAYRDSTGFFTPPGVSGASAGLAYERAGTYAVTVHANGYRDWTKSGVVVTAGECHVNGVQLTARLLK